MERLRQWLSTEGKTQTEFAAVLGVTQPTVSEWLSGESTPSVDMLKRISKHTGITIDELLNHQIRRAAPRSAARA